MCIRDSLYTILFGFLIGYLSSNVSIRHLFERLLDFTNVSNKPFLIGSIFVGVAIFALCIYIPLNYVLDSPSNHYHSQAFLCLMFLRAFRLFLASTNFED
eukprot:TRINITY_DN3478_c0_g2_i2.p1 TRINITY_DN3478_c0_g2~~TRINITY_DN3478_c0_g2_i2.p1  ORF type:complete len:100 (-),score=9.61 TRINITY_DN3478_c0_g2_i2:335-634(-)